MNDKFESIHFSLILYKIMYEYDCRVNLFNTTWKTKTYIKY